MGTILWNDTDVNTHRQFGGHVQWQDDAMALADKGTHPNFTRIMNRLLADEAYEGPGVEEFVEIASKIPGWDAGPANDPFPILFEL